VKGKMQNQGMGKEIKILRSPFEMFIIVSISIVVVVTILFDLITFSVKGTMVGLSIGLMIGVPLGVAAGFWQAIQNGKTIEKTNKKVYTYYIKKK
jgi:hypothetical protein